LNALFIVLFVNKNKKTVEKVAFQGPQVIVAGSARLYFLGFQGLKNSRGPRGNGFPGSPWHPYAQDYTVFFTLLTLIGMREGTIHPLSFLDQILSAEFISKISKLFWR
jgi:hypothetical protein